MSASKEIWGLTTEGATALTACIDGLVAGIDLSGGRPPVPNNGRYRQVPARQVPQK